MTMIERVARAIFRAGFDPDELEMNVQASWDEWQLDREAAFRKARRRKRTQFRRCPEYEG